MSPSGVLRASPIASGARLQVRRSWSSDGAGGQNFLRKSTCATRYGVRAPKKNAPASAARDRCVDDVGVLSPGDIFITIFFSCFRKRLVFGCGSQHRAMSACNVPIRGVGASGWHRSDPGEPPQKKTATGVDSEKNRD